jgi:hypothetical protein
MFLENRISGGVPVFGLEFIIYIDKGTHLQTGHNYIRFMDIDYPNYSYIAQKTISKQSSWKKKVERYENPRIRLPQKKYLEPQENLSLQCT